MGFVKAVCQLKYPYCTIYNDYLYNILNISITSTIVLIIYYSIFTNMQKKSLFPWTDVNGQKKSTYRCKYSWCGRRDLNPHAVRRQILSLVRLPIPPHPHFTLYIVGGGWWIRTTESNANRFTVCPLWPLGKSSTLELVIGIEPTTCWLQVSCSTVEPHQHIGGNNRTRTCDPLINSQLLYQLSHIPAIFN